MFTFEEGVNDTINIAVDKYEKHFSKEFPVYEYLSMTKSKDYDFSVKGSKRLADFIDKRIKANNPVEIPEGYEERLY